MARDELRDDEPFASRFAEAFDDIVASDELKASTLAAIFAQTEGEEVSAGAAGAEDDEPGTTDGSHAGKVGEHPTFTLVGGGVGALDDARGAGPATDLDALPGGGVQTGAPVLDIDDAARPVDTPVLAAVRGGKGRAGGVRHHRSLRLRVAAVVVAVALTAGGVAYAVPASQVEVTEDGTTIRLGVNVFGVAVSADAETDAGKAVLRELDLRNVGYEDALGRVIDKLDERGGDGSVHVQVDGPFGAHRNDLSDRADRVIAWRGLERGAGVVPDAPPSGEASVTGDSADAGATRDEASPTALSPTSGSVGRGGGGARGWSGTGNTRAVPATPEGSPSGTGSGEPPSARETGNGGSANPGAEDASTGMGERANDGAGAGTATPGTASGPGETTPGSSVGRSSSGAQGGNALQPHAGPGWSDVPRGEAGAGSDTSSARPFAYDADESN